MAAHCGLDFGSLGMRAALAGSGKPGAVPWESGNRPEPGTLLCVAEPGDPLGVSFRSLKKLIGVRSAEGESIGEAAEGRVLAALQDLRTAVEARSGLPAGCLSVAVPALYGSSRRSALRALALSAGFADVQLVSDGMAVAIAHAHGLAEARTLLVCTIGYGGCELTLVRAARGHYQSIACYGAETACGAAFDALLLGNCVETLIAHSVWPGAGLPAAHWMQLRDAVQTAREALSTAASARLFLPLGPGGSQGRTFQVDAAAMHQACASLLRGAVEPFLPIMADARISRSDIDALLVSGGCARIPFVPRVLAECLGVAALVLPGASSAEGAAIHAAQLAPTSEGIATRGPDNTVFPASSTGIVDLSGDPADAGQMPRPERTQQSAAGHQYEMMQYPRALIERGNHDGAREFLRQLVEQANTMLAHIPGVSPLAGPETQTALQRSGDFLKERRYPEAIEQAHLAYQLEPDNPDVFEEMIEIHCAAATARSAPDEYTEAMRWLMCAHSHDRTNPEVHNRIADRSYLHARHLAGAGDRAGALTTLENCLRFNPGHTAGRELETSLRAQSGPG
jgi:hypothetical protein